MGVFGKKEPKKYKVLGKLLKCPFCENEWFWHREAQLNTSLATFLGLDWANESVNCFVCSNCGRIEWFVPFK
jgi:hypothetical protein